VAQAKFKIDLLLITELTQQLKLTCHALGHIVHITPMDISICSLQSSSAMAQLCANINTGS